jgi:hypothetical protein
MSRVIVGLITAGLIVFAAAPAAAQGSRPQSTKPSIGLFGIFDVSSINAKQSFDAVFGEHVTMGPGVGVEVTNLWKGFFVRIAGTHSKLSGERVVIFNGEVFSLGIPLKAELTPIEFGGGWRFQSRYAASRIVPYAGASAITLKYKETSSFAEASENADESYTGFGIFGGVDVRIAKQVFGGIEGQYRSIKFTPGANSAADSFDETNMGGGVLRLRLGIRF